MSAFKARTIDGKLLEEVKGLINQKDRGALKRFIDPMRAADLADLIEHLSRDERLFIFHLLEPEGAGEVLVEIEPPVQERILKDLDNQAISQIVEELNSDDAADLVGDLPAERAREVIESVGDEVTQELEKLLPYPDDTAGGIMALEFVAVKADATVQDAIESIRAKREEVENLYYIWVTDDFEKLVGVISLKDLLLEDPEKKISEVMNPEVISVNAKTDQEEVVNLVRRYDLVNIPVVDDSHRLVGRITHDDIIDVIEEETDEDISLMAGVIDEEIAEESTIRISRARLPWLVVALFGGILAALVIDQFEPSLEKMITLSFFFPVVMAMGGNTGIQAATVVVRGLATGDISVVNIGKRLWMEMRVALINGMICGLILGLVVGFWLNDYRVGFIMTTALILIILISGLIGSAVPLFLKRLNIDPALAAGPFVTTSNDILSLFIYLGLMTIFLRITH
ncbi:MAG: magnesium transporter [Pseudomonadota bacterium]|nr:magnesium transporter [Desulfobacterales bacterium]MBL7171658.1 magnesium transporter [Desulfobacteraceae bacterium]MBU0736146.1 magnesium transporter [Pseudomonadota bacterium]